MTTGHNAAAESKDGIIVLVSARLRRFFCGLHGHTMVLNFEPSRISLQCTSCPYETPGWTLKEPLCPAPSARRRLPLPQSVLVEQNAQ